MRSLRYRNFVSDSERWDAFVARDGDIVICTQPKCGTTWLQRICSLLIFQTIELPAPLTAISPWLDVLTAPVEQILSTLDAQTHRRFIKTHTPLDGLPFHPEVTYIGVGRDPRDVALSWDNHMLNMDFEVFFTARAAAVGTEGLEQMAAMEVPADSELGRFRQWMDAEPPIDMMPTSLQGVLHHQQTLWARRGEPNVVLLHYADLSADLDGQMRRLAAALGIAVDESVWPALVHAATFGEMKRMAADLVPESTIGLFPEPDRFFNRGTSGAWRDIVTDEDRSHYDARVA
ncbi:MAG: aryl sulfotransferase, partial [Actinomycetota bacterium]|nr:aryl sulfotransferase [Actinomycetota bacterium]